MTDQELQKAKQLFDRYFSITFGGIRIPLRPEDKILLEKYMTYLNRTK